MVRAARWNADVDAGVVVEVAHFENDAEFAFADFAAVQ